MYTKHQQRPQIIYFLLAFERFYTHIFPKNRFCFAYSLNKFKTPKHSERWSLLIAWETATKHEPSWSSQGKWNPAVGFVSNAIEFKGVRQLKRLIGLAIHHRAAIICDNKNAMDRCLKIIHKKSLAKWPVSASIDTCKFHFFENSPTSLRIHLAVVFFFLFVFLKLEYLFVGRRRSFLAHHNKIHLFHVCLD